MNINNNVYDALKILINISKNAQENAQETSKCLSLMEWMREYCTVRASTARRGGHTTAILKLMEENDMNIGCIFQNNDLKKMFQSLYNSRQKSKGKLEFCISRHETDKLLGRNFSELDALVIDNSFFYSEKEEKRFYNSLNPALFADTGFRPFFLIFLQ